MSKYLGQIKQGAARGLGFGTVVLMMLSLSFLVAQQMNSFSSGQVVSAAEINANFVNLQTNVTNLQTNIVTIQGNIAALQAEVALRAPVGSVVAWHKNLAGVPAALPAGWVECNGGTVNDSASPLDGTTIPDLNGQARFLRGSGTSGTLQNATKVVSIAEIGSTNEVYVGKVSTPVLPQDVDAWVDEGTSGRMRVDTGPPGLNPQRPDAYRVRSINMSVVWIMRFK